MDRLIRIFFGVFLVAIIALLGYRFLGKSASNQEVRVPASAPVLTQKGSDKPTFKIAWSIYAGWMPWDYADKKGIIKKWADRYNINIEMVQVNDYVQSINQYSSGDFSGVTIASMDALTIPAAGGVDTTAVIIGDYSDGNDGILLKNGQNVADLKGKTVNLVEYSVSHYLLNRALEKSGLSLKDVKTVNSSDANLVSAFGSPDVPAIVTWNPILDVAKKQPGAHLVFSSRDIPAEILDLLVVNTQTLEQHPELGKALVGAWYETLAVMGGEGEEAKAARAFMAEAAGTDLPSFEKQLAATHFYRDGKSLADFYDKKELGNTMGRVAKFAFDNHLLGEKAVNDQHVGIQTPDAVWGSADNVKLRFNRSYTDMAAAGKL